MSEAVKYFRFEGLLQACGWVHPAFTGIDEQGRIVSISEEKPVSGKIEYVDGYAIPGFQNAHSHAFQYAMAGLAEIHSTNRTPDDFWSWREAMYSIALSIDPDQMEAIASQLYAEMLRHGYTHVAEFHYVHHDKGGQAYSNMAEMGERLVAAAIKAGIKITLVPMFYEKGGFGKDPSVGQRRFISATTDEYLKLIGASEAVVNKNSMASLGFGFHSIRAVSKDSMLAALPFAGNRPIHIHIAEQLKEVGDSLEFYGQRPVEWLYENVAVDDQWHLVHATHLSQKEIQLIAKSQANVVLCPSTEGNLGDGIFPLKEYQNLSGRWSIGTDSHIGLDPKEELRILDYGQRLTSHKRNTFYSTSNGDSGAFGFNESILSGRTAMGTKNTEYFVEGAFLDAAVITRNHPLIATSKLEHLLSTYIYSGDSSFNLGTLVNGKWVVKNNHHLASENIARDFIKSVRELQFR